jgi:Transglutaminase-like superfamily
MKWVQYSPMLTRAAWRLVIFVAVVQVLTSIALRALSIARVRAAGLRCRRLRPLVIDEEDDRVIWAIEATGRRLGRSSTCLVRALAAEILLDPRGGPVILTIGVKRTGTGTLEAHAWLARNGQILIGGSNDEYAPLVSWTS